MHPRFWFTLAALLVCCVSGGARGDPPDSPGEDAIDERQADGDIDEEDRAVMPIGAHMGATGSRSDSWISLVGFHQQSLLGRSDVGGMVVVGLALDRFAAGPSRSAVEPSRPDPSPPTAPQPAPTPGPAHRVMVTPSLARACVRAALQASGLGVDDSIIDNLLTRARESAWLPETRMRALRLVTDGTRAATLATTDGTSYYDTLGTHLLLEIRLTWRFDRLLYAGDEPALERVRLQRQAARSRLTDHTLELLFAWQRAVVEQESLPPGSNEEMQQRMRASEVRANLDVLTGGWFSRRGD